MFSKNQFLAHEAQNMSSENMYTQKINVLMVCIQLLLVHLKSPLCLSCTLKIHNRLSSKFLFFSQFNFNKMLLNFKMLC